MTGAACSYTPSYTVTLGRRSYSFGDLKEVLAKASPGRSGDVLAGLAAASAEDLIEWCKAHLASYKTPRAVSFAPSLPRNAAGKLVRHEIRLAY